MTEALNGVINQLLRQKTAIEQALAALRSIEETPAPVPPSDAPVMAARAECFTPGAEAKASIGGAKEAMGREESGKRARRKFGEGCAPKGSYHTGGAKATCRGDEAALGGQARGFGGKEDGTQTARHEENGVKIDSKRAVRTVRA